MTPNHEQAGCLVLGPGDGELKPNPGLAAGSRAMFLVSKYY